MSLDVNAIIIIIRVVVKSLLFFFFFFCFFGDDGVGYAPFWVPGWGVDYYCR